MSFIHFGVRVQEHESNHINKATYLSAKPEHMPGWTDEHYDRQLKKASLNYDLNMRFFSTIDPKEFDNYIFEKCQKWPFTQCFNLNELSGVPGIYMLVLDSFKQVYIGQSGDIRRRIRGHWSKKKSLERLIFGQIWNSNLSIDSFGPLDTTRIFCIPADETVPTDMRFYAEKTLVADFDPIYTLNRTEGGAGAVTDFPNPQSYALMEVMANRREKNFLPLLNINQLKSVMTDTEFQDDINGFPQFAFWVKSQQQ